MKFLREPLFHFLLIGAVLFVVFDFVSDPSRTAANKQIEVSAGRIQQLANIFAKTWQRPPTTAELTGLVDDFVLEEIYYRQAVAMGIDRDDTVIRRRLRQKFEFLTDDVAATVQPTDEELAAYLAANPGAFKRDTTYTFEQVYVNPEQTGVDLETRVADLLSALRTGSAPPLNSGLLPSHFDGEPARVVDSTFGTGFSTKLDVLTPGEWQGPVESGLGLHLVQLETRVEGTLPQLADIRPVVEREWANVRRLETRRMINEQLLKDYEVVIEWPQASTMDASETP